jgi:tetratricopeptide (TPR) repeat protein
MYADSFREAETAADKVALAKRMIEAARQVPDGSSDQYILLTIARDVVAGAGDAETALLAIDRLAEQFDVDAVAIRSETLLAAAAHATSAVQAKAVVAAAVAVIEDLSKERQYELALDVCEAAEGAAAKTKESALIRKLAGTKADLHHSRERFKRYQQALAVLENDSEDPAANHAAGSYLCFVEDDWERGGAMLALGDIPEFQGAAVLEQRQARSPEEQVAVGDAWWTLAETHESPDRDALRRRAEFWYRKAAPHLPEGLAKLKINQRLEVRSQLGSSTTTPLETADSARREPTGEQADQMAQWIVDAQEALDRQDQIEARRKLLQVNQLDDGNPQACFYLGLLAALDERNGSDARKYFIRAQRSGLENVACLNNLALTAVRMRDVSQAVGHWRKAIELGSAPEVSHNLGVLFRLADRKRVNVPVGIRETLAQYQNAARATSGETWEHRGTLRGNGWWYMDFIGESAVREDWRWPSLSDRTCMQCNGLGTADCPVSACSRGRVRQSTVDTIPLPGGHVVKKQRIIPVACGTCRGTGRIRCPFCRNGIDGDL